VAAAGKRAEQLFAAPLVPDGQDQTGAGPGELARHEDTHAVKALRVVQLVISTPALYARFLERQGEWQAELARQIAGRRGRGDDLYPTLAAGMALTALLAVVRRWSDSNGEQDPIPLLNRAFDQLGPAL
jgi:MftR C-terminal domain